MTVEALVEAPLPGEILAEKYRVERMLGSGGMGVVVAATHVHLKERYALKVLRPSALSDPLAVERFLREGRASVKIQSEHVARVYDVGELADRTPYIVMELLEGSDFGEVLQAREKIPFAEAVGYVLEAAEAVAEAHALGIVHRDLKPSNLFLASAADGKKTVKVLDFGISKMSALDPTLPQTQTATILGSPLYMSPEQLKSARDVDARSDIWSFGILLFQLISGEPPYAADSMAEQCALVLSGKKVPLKGVPRDLSDAVATCLAIDRADRFQNLAEFANAIAKHGGPTARISADAIIARLGLPEKRPARPARWPLAAAATGATILIAFLAGPSIAKSGAAAAPPAPEPPPAPLASEVEPAYSYSAEVAPTPPPKATESATVRPVIPHAPIARPSASTRPAALVAPVVSAPPPTGESRPSAPLGAATSAKD
jgi:serine/threonine-protein kinase